MSIFFFFSFRDESIHQLFDVGTMPLLFAYSIEYRIGMITNSRYVLEVGKQNGPIMY